MAKSDGAVTTGDAATEARTARAKAIAAQKYARTAQIAAEAAEAARQAALDAEAVVELTEAADQRQQRGFHRWQAWAAGAVAAGVVAVIAVALVVVMALDHREYQDERASDRQLVDGARSAAKILISPSGANAEQSAAAILDRATGSWYDEFSKNQRAFAGVLAQSNTNAKGNILAAGLEKRNSDGGATILIAGQSSVSNSAGADNEQRTWRMRFQVVEVDGMVKVSHVEVVP